MVLFIWGNTALASVWFMNKSAPNKTAEVDVTAIMWGVPDAITENTKDRIVFQVASSEYREVKLILESDTVRGEKLKLSIPTRVHTFKSTSEYTSWSYSRNFSISPFSAKGA